MTVISIHVNTINAQNNI